MHYDDYGDSPVTTVINEHLLLFVIFIMINILEDLLYHWFAALISIPLSPPNNSNRVLG